MPERGPLRLHGRAELLYLPVDLSDARGIVLYGLDTVGGESREHDVRGHAVSSCARGCEAPLYPIPRRLRRAVGPPRPAAPGRAPPGRARPVRRLAEKLRCGARGM